MTDTQRRELTAAELDLVGGGLENAMISGYSFMAPRNGSVRSFIEIGTTETLDM